MLAKLGQLGVAETVHQHEGPLAMPTGDKEAASGHSAGFFPSRWRGRRLSFSRRRATIVSWLIN
jgi:hypothetical protein